MPEEESDFPVVQISDIEDEEQVVIEIPEDYVVWSVNPRGDHTYITIKKVVL